MAGHIPHIPRLGRSGIGQCRVVGSNAPSRVFSGSNNNSIFVLSPQFYICPVLPFCICPSYSPGSEEINIQEAIARAVYR